MIHFSYVTCCNCFVFFFKQKTAYEMRISDWSSDVCSSDLALEELDATSCLGVLTSVEAAVRVDYLSRVYARKKDPLSLAIREIYKERENAARLEDDLLRAWRDSGVVGKALIGELIGAFKYRHWLAHGRYCSPKFGRIYDYVTVYGLAEELLDAIAQY